MCQVLLTKSLLAVAVVAGVKVGSVSVSCTVGNFFVSFQTFKVVSDFFVHDVFLQISLFFGRFSVPLCCILPHFRQIVNDNYDNKYNKHHAEIGANDCVEYDNSTKPPCRLVWGFIAMGKTLRRNP